MLKLQVSPSLGKKKRNRLSSGKLAPSFLLLNSSHSEQKIKQRTINIHTAGQTGVNQFPQTNCVAFPFFPSPKKDLRHDQGGDWRPETGQRACSQECHLIPRRGSLRGACSLSHSHSQSVSHMAIRCEGAVTLESFYGGVTQRGEIHATS